MGHVPPLTQAPGMDDHTTTTELPPPVSVVRAPGRSEPDLLSTRQKSRRAAHAKWVLLLIVLVAAGAALAEWYVARDTATTDDAYTDGHAVTVAPQVAG